MKVLPTELQTARYALTRTHPYISSLLLSLNFIEQPGLGTIGVDKHWRCYYDPETIQRWSINEIEGVLFHESNHLLRSHPERAEHFDDHHKMNIAEDIEINPDVIECGLQLPGDALYPGTFGLKNGLLAEEYYHKIPDSPKMGKGHGGVAAGKCGSCAGNPNEGEQDSPAPGDGISKAEQELIKRQVAKEIESAAKSQGNVPAGLKRWAEATLHPQVKWTKELASVCRRAMIEVMGKVDRTFKRPSRVASALGGRIVLPGWKAYIPNVALVQDTSGSMGQSDLNKSLAETKGVLQALGGGGWGVTYISVDCAVGSKQKINRVGQVQMNGGGGTDMGIGLAAAEETRPMPHIVIVLTDGDTPWPSVPPPFKVIVVLTSGDRPVPAWSKKIVVN